MARRKPPRPLVSQLLVRHFKPVPLEGLVSSARSFPATARVDLLRALEIP